MLPWVIGFDECGDALLEIGLWHIGIFILEGGRKEERRRKKGREKGR